MGKSQEIIDVRVVIKGDLAAFLRRLARKNYRTLQDEMRYLVQKEKDSDLR